VSNDVINLPEWISGPIAVFDLETTGLDLKSARIVTACAVKIDPDGKQIGNSLEWLADPGIPIPAIAAEVHGITTEFARTNGKNLREVVVEIVETLSGYFSEGIPVIAYNAPYDFTILKQHAIDFGIEWPELPPQVVDPLVLDRQFDRYRKGGKKLTQVAPVYGVVLHDAHNATADAIAAGQVLQAMARKFSTQLNIPLEDLFSLQKTWSSEQEKNFADFMHRQGKTDFVYTPGWPEKF